MKVDIWAKVKEPAGLCSLGLGIGLIPGLALACALPPSVILTLPTGHYITAAALTVAMTALAGPWLQRLPRSKVYDLGPAVGSGVEILTSYVAFLAFLALLFVGIWGPTDPMHNLLTLVFWTGVWIVVPLVSMVFGNIWRWINPWSAPVRITRTLLGVSGKVGLGRYGQWPAVAGMLGFTWFQLVSLSPEDPMTLVQAAGTYWAFIYLLAVFEGEDWLEQGEFLTVMMRYLSCVAPIWIKEGRFCAGLPGTQILDRRPLTLSQMAFVSLTLAALSFDGLIETFWWHSLIGENPLEPTGRSAVIFENTLGLIAVWGMTALCLGIVIALGRKLGGASLAAGPVMLSFLCIAAGYHVAHYLVMLLTTGQYTLAALNDPLFQGDTLLGLGDFFVSFGFLTDSTAMQAIYATQFAAILGAHILAMILSFRLCGPDMRIFAHAPMGLFMVIYTVFGLWLLSTARTG